MDQFVSTISSIESILLHEYHPKSSKSHLKQVLSLLTGSNTMEVKINSLLFVVHWSREDKMKQCLSQNELLYDFIQKRCYNETDRLNSICLECTKYFGTVAQIDKYRQLIDDLSEQGVDLPNSYHHIQQLFDVQQNIKSRQKNKEEEQLRLFQQLVYDHQLDISALIDIVKTTEKLEEKQQQILNIYQDAFADRISQLEKLIMTQGILTNEQVQQLSQIKLFEKQFLKHTSKHLKQQKYDSFRKWICQELNFTISQKDSIHTNRQSENAYQNETRSNMSVIKKSSSILVIENRQPDQHQDNRQSDSHQDRARSFINPFVEAERKLNAFFNYQMSLLSSVQLAEKCYSGNIVKEHFDPKLVSEFDEKQLKKVKKACIRNKQILFDSHEIQLGVMKKQITKEELFSNFLELTFVIGNKTTFPLENCELLFEEPKGLQFWLPTEQIDTIIPPRKQEKMRCLIAYQHLLFEPLKGQFQWVEDDKVFEAKFMVPCLLSQFMTFTPIRRKYFKFIWNNKKEFCHRSEIFKLNQKVMKSILDFKKYNPMLCYLVDLQDFLDLKKDLKLGGEFTLQDPREKHWIKIIVRQNLDVVIKVTGLFDAVQVIKCLEFILRV